MTSGTTHDDCPLCTALLAEARAFAVESLPVTGKHQQSSASALDAEDNRHSAWIEGDLDA